MAVVTLGPEGEAVGTAFLYSLISVAAADAQIIPLGSTELHIVPDPQRISDNLLIDVTGTTLNGPDAMTQGVVTGLSFVVDDSVEFSISGLSLSLNSLQTAINQPDDQSTTKALADVLKSIDFQIDFSTSTEGSLIFGSGGDDTITLGSGQDYLLLDGGADISDAGGGDDFIYARPFLFGLADGLTTVTGGEGSDTFCLDFREFTDQGEPIELVEKGQKVDLGKLFVTGDTVFKLVSIENLRGSSFGDQLTGTNDDNRIDGEEGNDKLIGKGGLDTLDGGVGDDKLTGGADVDTMTGGKGDDFFIYTDVTDSGNEHDIITDFQHKHDKIDLSKLHPDTKNDKFVFIGDSKFGHHAGELQVVQHDNSGTANDFTMVLADLDGNGKAELQIELSHLRQLDEHDFML